MQPGKLRDNRVNGCAHVDFTSDFEVRQLPQTIDLDFNIVRIRLLELNCDTPASHVAIAPDCPISLQMDMDEGRAIFFNESRMIIRIPYSVDYGWPPNGQASDDLGR